MYIVASSISAPAPCKKDLAYNQRDMPLFLQYCSMQLSVAVQEVLRKMILDTENKGELWTRQWDKVPLPVLSAGASHPVMPSAATGRPSK